MLFRSQLGHTLSEDGSCHRPGPACFSRLCLVHCLQIQLGPAISEDAYLPAGSAHLATIDKFAADDSLRFSRLQNPFTERDGTLPDKASTDRSTGHLGQSI